MNCSIFMLSSVFMVICFNPVCLYLISKSFNIFLKFFKTSLLYIKQITWSPFPSEPCTAYLANSADSTTTNKPYRMTSAQHFALPHRVKQNSKISNTNQHLENYITLILEFVMKNCLRTSVNLETSSSKNYSVST